MIPVTADIPEEIYKWLLEGHTKAINTIPPEYTTPTFEVYLGLLLCKGLYYTMEEKELEHELNNGLIEEIETKLKTELEKLKKNK
jgi:hypothetical protein